MINRSFINTDKIRVHFWDQMVLIGFGLALFYSIFDSILYIFLSYDVDFFQRLFGPDISEIFTTTPSFRQEVSALRPALTEVSLHVRRLNTAVIRCPIASDNHGPE